MSRIHPVNYKFTEPKIKRLLDIVKHEWGRIPNFFLSMANSPATLEAYLKFKETLEEGDLSFELQEKLALTVASTCDCAYSAAAHLERGKNFGLGDQEMRLNLRGDSFRERDKAALQFAKKIIECKGFVGDEDFKNIKKAGFTQGQIIQILAEVSLNLFTNYLNHLAKTDLDYPEVKETLVNNISPKKGQF